MPKRGIPARIDGQQAVGASTPSGGSQPGQASRPARVTTAVGLADERRRLERGLSEPTEETVKRRRRRISGSWMCRAPGGGKRSVLPDGVMNVGGSG